MKSEHTPIKKHEVFHTPNKTSNEASFINTHTHNPTSIQKIIQFLSSEKKMKHRCNQTDECKCSTIGDLMKQFALSPTSNYLFHSPSSLEKYLDSLSQERINMVKLVVNNNMEKNEKESSLVTPLAEQRLILSNEAPRQRELTNLEQSTKKNLFAEFEQVDNTTTIFQKKKKRQESPLSLFWERETHSPMKFLRVETPTAVKTERKITFNCSEAKTNQFSCFSTFNTTQKKDRKRMRKNDEQIDQLKEAYKQNKDWSKEHITLISERINLAENKVYKWLWDQKNKEYCHKRRFIVQSGK